jgi:hypothetical protein
MLAQPVPFMQWWTCCALFSSCVVFIAFLHWGIENINSRKNGGLQSKLTEVQQEPNEAAVPVAQYIALLRKCFAFNGDN